MENALSSPRLCVNEGPFRVPSPMFAGGCDASPQTSRILVVDDDRNHRHVLEELLAEAGYEVEVAADGLEALAAIERMPPALLLLDLRMPNLDGIGVLERLRHEPRTFPIVVFTALQDADAEVIARGAASVLTKPVSLDALLDTVRRFL
jgi:CheY-like chemotaxis protein